MHQELLGAIQRYDAIVDAFRQGGGVALRDFPEDVHTGIARFTAMWHEHLLTQQWLPAVPQAKAMLERGVDVADVGCGQGRALIKLVETFPQSRYVGYDSLPSTIGHAVANAEAAGVAGRIRFMELDASKGLPESFDLITTWDVIHDAVDPLGVLQSIREALRPGGIYLCLDINCSDVQTANVGPVASLLYGFSTLLCMTVSLADGGEGLGTMGLPESKLRELATRAGFSSVTRVPMENPFNNLYLVRRRGPSRDEASSPLRQRQDKEREGETMYGTIMRARVKPGQKDALEARLMAWPGREEPDGFHSAELAWEDGDPDRVLLVVHFRDKESYRANAESPDQNADYEAMVELLDGEPEWIDVNYAGHMGQSPPA